MNYNVGFYTPQQFVQSVWMPIANQALSRSGLPGNLYPETQDALDNFGLPLAIDFVGYEFEGRPIIEENARNVVAAVIEYTIAMVMSRYNLGCPQFQECIKYITSRIDVVMQRKTMMMPQVNQMALSVNPGLQQLNPGMVSKYGQNIAVQPQYQAPAQLPIQGYQQPQRQPLPTSTLVAAINSANKPKGEDMDVNNHLLHVNQENYRFKVCSDAEMHRVKVQNENRILASISPQTSVSTQPKVEPDNESTVDFHKTTLFNELSQIVIIPGYEFEIDTDDIYFSAKPITPEDSLVNVFEMQRPILERYVDVKTIIVDINKDDKDNFIEHLKTIKSLTTLDEIHENVTLLQEIFKVSYLVSWISSNLSQYILLALSERYGLEESGFPFITNYAACIEFLKGNNGLREDIYGPVSEIIISRYHQLMAYVELSSLECPDKVQYLVEIDLIKPRLVFPWFLNYRKSDNSLGAIVNKQRLSIDHIFSQAFKLLDTSILYLDILDISGNEYRVFRGSTAQFSPVNYRIQPILI